MIPISYENLGQGAAAEMFDRELEKVLGSINDINRPYKPKREIALKVAFYPDEDREKIRIEIAVNSSGPGFKTCETIAYLGSDPKDRAKLLAYEKTHPNQQRLPFMTEEDQPPVVTGAPAEERKMPNA